MLLGGFLNIYSRTNAVKVKNRQVICVQDFKSAVISAFFLVLCLGPIRSKCCGSGGPEVLLCPQLNLRSQQEHFRRLLKIKLKSVCLKMYFSVCHVLSVIISYKMGGYWQHVLLNFKNPLLELLLNMASKTVCNLVVQFPAPPEGGADAVWRFNCPFELHFFSQ